MLQILKKLNVLLDKKQKRTMVGLVVLMIIGAALQTAGMGMIMPVVSLVLNKENMHTPGLLNDAFRIIGGGSETRFIVIVMLALVAVFIIKNAFLYFQQKVTLAFVYTNQFRTSERMMKNYLRRGYEFFLNADTAVVQRKITSDVNNMYALVLALLQLVSDIIVFIFMGTLCFVQDPLMTVIITVVLVLLLVIIKKVLKPILRKAGEDNQNYYSGLFKHIAQTVQGIKEVKISCKEQYFVTEYTKCGKGYVDAVQKYSLYNQVPKLLIEPVCVAVLIGYMLYMILTGTDGETMITTLSAFAAAAVFLLPCVNRVNNQINNISYFEPFFMGVSDNLQDEINGENVDMSYATDRNLQIGSVKYFFLRIRIRIYNIF